VQMRLKREGRRFDPAPDHQFGNVIGELGGLRPAKVSGAHHVEPNVQAAQRP